jgi:hypothetical protein
MCRTFIIVAALCALAYVTVVPFAELYYVYNIQSHPWSDLCGWTPGGETKPCKDMR